MNMPGFTATRSLEKTTHKYASAQVGSVTPRATGMVPSVVQSPWSDLCSWPCWVDKHGDCICPDLGFGALPRFGTGFGF
jgi:hypothetical protein